MIRMVLEYEPATSTLNVNGPLQDRIQCLGLLELAKDAVLNFKANEALVVPVGSLPMLPGNGGRKM